MIYPFPINRPVNKMHRNHAEVKSAHVNRIITELLCNQSNIPGIFGW